VGVGADLHLRNDLVQLYGRQALEDLIHLHHAWRGPRLRTRSDAIRGTL
jgi:hypothetical protein